MSKPLSHELETVIDAINGTGHWASKDPKKISSSFGNITTIAKRLGVNRSTVYGYIKRWAGVREAINDARETRKDLVEDKMMKRIMEGSDTMVIFFAKTQMKDRGYVERHEQVTYDLSKATEEQLEDIASGKHPATVLANSSNR